jgi:hypothetical protein
LQTPSLPPEFAGAIFGARQTIFIDELFGFYGPVTSLGEVASNQSCRALIDRGNPVKMPPL